MKDNWPNGDLGLFVIRREERSQCWRGKEDERETSKPEAEVSGRPRRPSGILTAAPGSSMCWKIPYLLVNTRFCVSNLV